MELTRERVAEMYLKGEGIEIGALHNALKTPQSARVRYVDRLSVAELKKQYPELEGEALVEVDILDDGERLEKIKDSSQDFVIANHFIEHCQNPIGALLNMFRTLKSGGILFLAIPDKRCCFDADRPVTSLEHIMRDFQEGPAWSRREHFEEWTRVVNKVQGDDEIEKQIDLIMKMDYSIHYHVWTPFEMLELILALRRMADFELEMYQRTDVEAIFILRKGSGKSNGDALAAESALKKSDAKSSETGGQTSIKRRLSEQLNEMLSAGSWCIDRINFDGETLEIIGWALAPGGDHSDLGFTVNDKPFERAEYPSPRSDIAEIFWFKPGSDKSAFRCLTRIKREEVFKDGYAALKCVSRKTGLPIREEYNWYYPDDENEPALPEPERRRRVAGNEGEGLFRLEGFTTFKKLDLALRKHQDKGLEDFQNILDWGCGCGRVTRHFHRLSNSNVTGVDVDADNLDWCKKHLSFARFRQTPLHPPTDLESSSFDLLIGISVFAHLKPREQSEWLRELNRIAKPGAYLLMSILGEATVSQSRWTLTEIEQWREQGRRFVGNEDLKGYIEDDNYYVNAYLTPAYVRQNWSPLFDIVDIIPAYIGNQQDLVIMRKPE
jgi:SAM-dependent methyltransferase